MVFITRNTPMFLSQKLGGKQHGSFNKGIRQVNGSSIPIVDNFLLKEPIRTERKKVNMSQISYIKGKEGEWVIYHEMDN